jgi:acetyl-CoA carboxylase biotin carboxyl carrier protein
VDLGSRVEPDDTIAIIEVMKLMSPLKAGLSGVVTAILAENGATVARGDTLVVVDPGA